MKAHVGVDNRTRVIHSVTTTAANVREANCLEDLLRGEQTKRWGDSGYQRQSKTVAGHAPNTQNLTNRRTGRYGEVNEAERVKNRTKSRVRVRGEHPFLRIKRTFALCQDALPRLGKERPPVGCALANLYMARRRLLRMTYVRSPRCPARTPRSASSGANNKRQIPFQLNTA